LKKSVIAVGDEFDPQGLEDIWDMEILAVWQIGRSGMPNLYTLQKGSPKSTSSPPSLCISSFVCYYYHTSLQEAEELVLNDDALKSEF